MFYSADYNLEGNAGDIGAVAMVAIVDDTTSQNNRCAIARNNRCSVCVSKDELITMKDSQIAKLRNKLKHANRKIYYLQSIKKTGLGSTQIERRSRNRRRNIQGVRFAKK